MSIRVELGRWLKYNVLKELEDAQRTNILNSGRSASRSVRVFLVIESKWKASVGEFNHGDAQ